MSAMPARLALSATVSLASVTLLFLLSGLGHADSKIALLPATAPTPGQELVDQTPPTPPPATPDPIAEVEPSEPPPPDPDQPHLPPEIDLDGVVGIESFGGY